MAVLNPPARAIPTLLYCTLFVQFFLLCHTLRYTHTHKSPSSPSVHPCYSGGSVPVCLPACLSVCLLTGCGRNHLACWMSRSTCAVLVITLHSRRSERSSPQIASARQRGAQGRTKGSKRDKKKGHTKKKTKKQKNNSISSSILHSVSAVAPVVLLFREFYSCSVCGLNDVIMRTKCDSNNRNIGTVDLL